MTLPFPPIFLLPARLRPDEKRRLEDSISSLTHDIRQADIVLGNINRPARARFELRRLGLDTEPACDTGSDDTIKVLRLSWLADCLRSDYLVPFHNYLLYEGRRLSPAPPPTSIYSPPRLTCTPPSPCPLEEVSAARPALDVANAPYSCQRISPIHPPNSAFIRELAAIRKLRILRDDHIAVRAYSTAIASLVAFPHRLGAPEEVARLPGCGTKIASIFKYWKQFGQSREVDEASVDPMLAVLQLFYGIWGVGAATARSFYHKGWRDLDDIVEFGWASLNRVQQIGVKYYDEFQLKMDRGEVEAVGSVILMHARRLDPGFELVIAGGHRRGKQESGDVDVIVSHRDESKTLHFITKLLFTLESAGYITHSLTLSTGNSDRGQLPLPWRGGNNSTDAGGFDTLDKALVVWQDVAQHQHGHNPPHRRVDIIVSPWKTVGCALLGWSGDTTFQRDLRLYCKKEMGLKFDSSGIRNLADGKWVDLEGLASHPETAPNIETAEKRVMQGLRLTWRPPWERCTG